MTNLQPAFGKSAHTSIMSPPSPPSSTYPYLVPEQDFGRRALFWTASSISMFAACIFACLPDSAVFLKAEDGEGLR